MTREAPKLALAWTDGLKTKRYGTKLAAYYAIAKRMVVEKYPVWLQDEGRAYPGEGEGWSPALRQLRSDKAIALFFNAHGEWFDERRWRKFITRVARFLAFVDSKRSAAALLELRFGRDEDLKRAAAEHEACERASVAMAERARDIKAYIDARSAR